MSRLSRSNEYLAGKKLPGHSSPIRTVVVNKGVRIIQLEDGTHIRTNKQGLTSRLWALMSNEGRMKALRSMRKLSDGGVSVTIGGPKKGERRTYSTQAAAKSAVTRHYGTPK